MLFTVQSDENQGEFRGISDEIQMDFRGSQMVFRVTSGGFPMKFQMDFRAVFRGFSGYVSRPLNQILLRMYLEHKSFIVCMEVDSYCKIVQEASGGIAAPFVEMNGKNVHSYDTIL